MHNHSEEENPDWNRFWGYIPHPEESHHWGECMEDWHDYEWRKEQKGMNYKRKYILNKVLKFSVNLLTCIRYLSIHGVPAS